MDAYPSVPLLPSASRTTVQPSGTIVNGPPNAPAARGIKVTVVVTAIGTGSITVAILGVDANGNAYTILASAAIVGNGTTVLTVFPGAPVTANVSANDEMPNKFQVNVTANNANPVTYSLAYDMLR